MTRYREPASKGGAVKERTPVEEAEFEASRDPLRLEAARTDAIQRIEAHFLGLLQAGGFEDVDTRDEVRHLQWIHRSLVPAARSPELQLAAQQFVYAKQRIAAMKVATETEANAYDPATDTGWP